MRVYQALGQGLSVHWLESLSQEPLLCQEEPWALSKVWKFLKLGEMRGGFHFIRVYIRGNASTHMALPSVVNL